MTLPFLRPAGCPQGVDPATWRRAIATRASYHADALANLIAALDAMDGDADYEPALGSPIPIAVGQFPLSLDQTHWSEGLSSEGEQELEDEHGGDVQDEPHDYTDEGNGDFCAADEMTSGGTMTDEQRGLAWDEGERLLAQARSMLPPPIILSFERHGR